MKRRSLPKKSEVLVCWAWGVALPAACVFAQAGDVTYRSDRVLVRFAPGTVSSAKDSAHAQVQAVGVLREYTIVEGLQLVQVPEGQVLNAVVAYKANPNVLNAEPDYLMPTADRIPGDQHFNQLWGLHNRDRVVSMAPNMNPRVAAWRQPWAEGRNAYGVAHAGTKVVAW
jgi:hypothetical protein